MVLTRVLLNSNELVNFKSTFLKVQFILKLYTELSK